MELVRTSHAIIPLPLGIQKKRSHQAYKKVISFHGVLGNGKLDSG